MLDFKAAYTSNKRILLSSLSAEMFVQCCDVLELFYFFTLVVHYARMPPEKLSVCQQGCSSPDQLSKNSLAQPWPVAVQWPFLCDLKTRHKINVSI